MGNCITRKETDIFRTSDASMFANEIEDFKNSVHIGQIITIKKIKKIANENGKATTVTTMHSYMVVDKTDNFVVCQSIKSSNAPYKECFLWIDAFNACMGNENEDVEINFDE